MDTKRLLCPTLVGRAGEIERFDALLDDLENGSGGTLVMSGEAGIGKSALVRQLGRQSGAMGFPLLVGECTAVEARRSFRPFADVADALIGRGIPGVSAEWLDRTYPDLARLRRQPGIAERDTRGGDESERFRVHGAFARFLRTVAGQVPLVVAIEDVHWADEATLELIPFLAKKLADVPLLLVATYRTSGEPLAPLLDIALAQLERDRSAEQRTLAPLDAAEVAQLVAATLGLRGTAATEILRVLETCEGNPFFAEEVLIALAHSGDLVARGHGWEAKPVVRRTAVPRSVAAAVDQRLRALPADALRTVRSAGVIGTRFEFELLRRVTGRSEAALTDDLGLAVEKQLVTESDTERDVYRFRHALTREAVLAGLLERERTALHRAVGEQIELQGDEARWTEELAYHFDAAGDLARAARYHELAARAAIHVSAFARAQSHLERCLELAPVDHAGRPALLLELCSVASEANERERAAAAAAEAHAIATSRADDVLAARALIASCAPLFMLGRAASAADAFARACAILEPLGESADLAEALSLGAVRAIFDGRYEDAESLAPRAMLMARATGNVRAEVFATNWTGCLQAQRGEPSGFEMVRGAARLALAHGLVHPAIRSHLNLYFLLRAWTYPLEEVEAALREASTLANRRGSRIDRLVATEAGHAFRVGRWDDALRLAAELQESAFHADIPLWAAFAETARHGPARGLTLLDAPRAKLVAAGATLYTSKAAHAAEVRLVAGDLRGALAEADPAATLLDRFDAPAGTAIAAIAAATALGDDAARQRWLGLAASGERATDHPAKRARIAYARAELAADEGDGGRSIAILDAEAELLARALEPYAWTLTQLRRAELLLRRGWPTDRDAAGRVFAAVVPYWRKAGAAWYLAKLREWAVTHELAFPRERRQPPAPHLRDAAGLTRREREVAALVAAGLTNRQIAERLVIAERTAEGHVERIREKLSFRTRTEIASWFVRAAARPALDPRA